MRIEYVPLIFGVAVALVGLALVADAWLPDHIFVSRERRRRQRAERSRGGEAALGGGVLCMAAALMGLDRWRYSVLAAIVGTVLLLFGVVLNRPFLRELVSFRGRFRRAAAPEAAVPPPRDTPSQPTPPEHSRTAGTRD